MHTDEYGITLSREVHIARKKVTEHYRSMQAYEAHFGMSSDLFLRKLETAELSADTKEFIAWRDQCAAWQRWKQKLQELEELYQSWR